mgnify:CR=1 FL=1
MTNELLIGVVSISDRASAGTYEDKGIPALRDWFGSALTSPWRLETRLIPDEQAEIEKTLIDLCDTVGCHLVVTTGGTGFGIMAMIAGAERGFIPRGEAIARIALICRFLEGVPRYRGAFAHWINGNTGATAAAVAYDCAGLYLETDY